MEQPEFSAMLKRMTSESPVTDDATHQPNNTFGLSTINEPSYDLGVMPELAFDFSLPLDSCDVTSFNSTYSESDMRAWSHNMHPTDAFADNDLSLRDRV